ncbi:MAG: PspC domain-containing protein [Candidatus Dojkabacteria bacterium]|jgi:phage shock protein C
MKKLYRSKKERYISGVCGGIAEYFDIDPIIPRLIFVLLLLGEGSGLLIYLILWLVLPEKPDKVVKKKAKTKKEGQQKE